MSDPLKVVIHRSHQFNGDLDDLKRLAVAVPDISSNLDART